MARVASPAHCNLSNAILQCMDINFPEPWDREISIRHGGFLPHWTKEGAIYHVRTRLADSLPQSVLIEWQDERVEIPHGTKDQCDNRSLRYTLATGIF